MPLLCRVSKGALLGGNPIKTFASFLLTTADSMSIARMLRLSVPEKRLLLSKQM